jgi:5-(carboxyamino)imidazole ribonucleotide synthase
MPKPIKPLPSLSTIGILGGGQLGRMMAMAAAEMGYHAHIYSPEKESPASEVARYNTIGEYNDIKKLVRFAESVDVVTYEFENIPASPVAAIAKIAHVFPSPQILATSQHRVLEKQALNNMGIATAPFVPVSSQEELKAAVKKLGLPSVLKTARMGYDGKGQVILRKESDVKNAIEKLASNELILEGFVDFTMEISVIVARDAKGNIECYCPVQNTHKHHILHETIAPAPISKKLATKAETVAKKIAQELDLIGLLAIEMFVTSDDKILVNEIAPRPHNSGHWTIDAAITSQFEQVIRAVCGLPLGNPARLCDARMLNLIGDDIDNWKKFSAMPNAKLHLYGKKETKSGRKMGHVTFLEKD